MRTTDAFSKERSRHRSLFRQGSMEIVVCTLCAAGSPHYAPQRHRPVTKRGGALCTSPTYLPPPPPRATQSIRARSRPKDISHLSHPTATHPSPIPISRPSQRVHHLQHLLFCIPISLASKKIELMSIENLKTFGALRDPLSPPPPPARSRLRSPRTSGHAGAGCCSWMY